VHHRVTIAAVVGVVLDEGADLEVEHQHIAEGCFDLTLCKLNFCLI